MIPIGHNLVRLSMQSKHYPRNMRFYPALFSLTYHLKSLRVKRRCLLGKKWVLYRPLTPHSTMERVDRAPYNLPASRETPL